jgi:peptide deformylase
MVYSVLAYGNSVFRKKCTDVELNEDVKKIVSNMFETMEFCRGVGLAAPQVGFLNRIFVIDSAKTNEDDERKSKSEKPIREVFINATMLEETGEMVTYEEGCLSIPGIYGNVDRPKNIKIRYYDAQLKLQEKEYTGFVARIIQHEYDHIEGVLFIDKLKPIKKQLIKRKLEDLKKGITNVRYKMKFAAL